MKSYQNSVQAMEEMIETLINEIALKRQNKKEFSSYLYQVQGLSNSIIVC